VRAVLLAALALACAAAFGQFYSAPKGTVPGESRVATNAAGVEVRVDQRLKEFVPLDAQFKDEEGRIVELRRYFGSKPVIIVPVFYKCSGICANEFRGLADALRGFKKDTVGREFTVVTISIDPTETPQVAATKKDTVIAMYMGPSTDRNKRVLAESGWHFLTGQTRDIRAVTDALGFKFTYDPGSGNIVHPQGIMVLTPQGQISRYFVSSDYPQQLLLNSIRDAGRNRIGMRDDRPFFLACIQVDPMTGQRTLNVLNAVKTLGVATIVAILASSLIMNLKTKASKGLA
jgi:protein SCO1